MSVVKNYGLFLVSLLIALIVLQVTLNLLKKAPVVGGFIGDAQHLSQDGSLS